MGPRAIIHLVMATVLAALGIAAFCMGEAEASRFNMLAAMLWAATLPPRMD